MPGPHSSLMVLPGRAGQEEEGKWRTTHKQTRPTPALCRLLHVHVCCNFKANTVARAAPRRVRLSGADPSVSRVHAGKVSFTTCPDKRKRENGQPKARFSHDRLSRSFLTAQDIRVAQGSARKAPASPTRYH